MSATIHDIGAFITTRFGAASTTADSEVDGAYVSRAGYQSGKLVLTYSAVLAEDETLTVAANWQDATTSGGSGVADYGTAYSSAVVATGGTGGSTETGTVELDVDFGGGGDVASEFVRGQATLTTSSTGTVTWTMTYVFGGADEVPAS